MFDAELRPIGERVLAPLAALVAPLGALTITVAGLVAGLASAYLASQQRWSVACLLWVVNRVLDGLDGHVARQTGTPTDRGGYADLMADFVVYAAIVIGVAFGHDTISVWRSAALCLAAFYLNTISWAYLSAIIEKQGNRSSTTVTSVELPKGLIEGAETAVAYTIVLLFPARSSLLLTVFGASVAFGALVRFVQGYRRLRT